MTSAPIDFVTVLTTFGPLATKRVTRDPSGQRHVESYGSPKFYRFQEIGVSSLDGLSGLLSSIERHSTSFVIRGKPRDGVDYRRARRLIRDKGGDAATLEPAARHWLPIDVDALGCPDWLDPFDEPDQTVEHVVSRLPPELHSASVRWQFTSSQGLKPGINLRLFFWSDRPLADWELKTWLADYPADLSIYQPQQPIYVARPIFVGMPDPVPFRSGVWRGDRDAVTVPHIDRPRAQTRLATRAPAGIAGTGYEHHCSRVGDYGGDGFYAPVKSAVAAWIARQGSGVETGWLRDDLDRVIRAAPRDPALHDDAYIEFRIADLDPLIAAILELQVDSEQAAEGVEPTYPAPLGSVAEARDVLADAMDRFARKALAWPETMRLAA